LGVRFAFEDYQHRIHAKEEEPHMDEDKRREPRLIPAEREALAAVDDLSGSERQSPLFRQHLWGGIWSVAGLDEAARCAPPSVRAEAVRGEAAEVRRGLLSEVRLVPEQGQLEIELVGNLAAMLTVANKNPRQTHWAGAKMRGPTHG